MNEVRTRNIRDPLYGFICLDEIEEKILQTQAFQRLRHIHQLGTTPWVYPSGNISRFEHSLGVNHLSKRLIEQLEEFECCDLQKTDVQVFKIASLLHDVGHGPFSHVGENSNLFEKGLDHDLMGEKIIKETELKDIITDNLDEKSVDRIVFIITGSGKPTSILDNVLSQLLTGQIGIDRMDYLQRDSYHLGVMYGKFDLARILETIRYSEDKDIYWEEGGFHSLEQFILARYFMFTEVYFHKTRRILDFHLSKSIKEYLTIHVSSETYPIDQNF